jgi:hypothetical protein
MRAAHHINLNSQRSGKSNWFPLQGTSGQGVFGLVTFHGIRNYLALPTMIYSGRKFESCGSGRECFGQPLELAPLREELLARILSNASGTH